MPIKSYTELIAWQKSMALVTRIYEITKTFPKDEIYGLTSQLRRAAVSVPSNIAEGQGRGSKGEFKHFLGNARGSLFEVQTQLHIVLALHYVDDEVGNQLIDATDEAGRILNGLITSLKES